MDNKSFEIQVLERLTAIETTLKQQDYKAINEKLNQTENRSINNKERIEKIDRDGQTFFIEGDKLYIEEIA